MAKYRKKPVVVEAVQWFKNGDHPQDHAELIAEAGDGKPVYRTEGGVVRYFCHPDIPGQSVCDHCGFIMHVHGWIDTIQGGHTVCPGDWIITDDRVADKGTHGHFYPCKPDIFDQTYEKVEDN